MNEKEVVTETDERSFRQSIMLSTFEEIAQIFLNSVNGERGNSRVFTSLQDYLDGSVLINGANCRRRKILLAIHDMKEELEAPSALQKKTLAKLEVLHLRPVPQVTFYQDVATAILRMEVVIRLEAMQAVEESAPGATGQLVTPIGEKRRWSMSTLTTMGYGLAAVACCAGAILFFQNGSEGELYTSASAQLAANGVEAFTVERDCTSNGDVGVHVAGNACALGASPPYNPREVLVIGDAISAAEFVLYSPMTEASFGSATSTSSRDSSPVREISSQSLWATSVEANYIPRPALLSEVKTQ